MSRTRPRLRRRALSSSLVAGCLGGVACLASVAVPTLAHADAQPHQSERALPMSNGLSRLQSRFLRDPDVAARLLAAEEPLDAKSALRAGIATFAPDDIDWADEIRIAFE